jgi:hypothetical protein
MVKYANKILCIGTGCNIQHVIHFSETKEFVFIDSQPRIKNKKLYLEAKFNKKEYVSDFVNNLLLTCLFNGFELETTTVLDKKYYTKIIPNICCYYISWFKKVPKNINPTMLVFTNKKTQQKIIYYISTNINFNINNHLRYDISSSDAIVVTDYFPEISILEYFGTSKIFIGYSNVNYQNVVDNKYFKNDILYFLHYYNCNRQYFFTYFYIVDNDSGIITKCIDFDNFLLYNINFMNKK